MGFFGGFLINMERLRIIKRGITFDLISRESERAQINVMANRNILEEMAHAVAPAGSFAAGVGVRRPNMMPLRCSMTMSSFWLMSWK